MIWNHGFVQELPVCIVERNAEPVHASGERANIDGRISGSTKWIRGESIVSTLLWFMHV